MKLTIGIIVLSIAGSAFGQMPNVIDNTRAKLNGAAQQKGADLNAVVPGVQQSSAKPSPSTSTVNGAASKTAAAAAKPAATPFAPKTQGIIVASSKGAAKTADKHVAEKKSMKDVSAKSDSAVAVEDTKNPVEPKKDSEKKINLTGRRDPFLSPVVSRAAGGSGCSSGKRCLAIDQIALKGIVKSENGMIAVVTNALEKAYFLHENDPVFNGYVVKITGDTIVFKETFQDKLGKSLTRDVTKKITTPSV
jgi:Tfp pilus assembly protein PilP